MNPFVDGDGLTQEWLSHALQRDVHLTSCEAIGTGQTSATYRLVLTGDGLPPTLVAKVAAGEDAERVRVRAGLRAEVGFYQHLRPTVDLRTPRCWYAEISDVALQFTLLLEDLAPRVPGVQADGCSPELAESAVRNLAGLHAPRWNDKALLEFDFLRQPSPELAAYLGGLTRTASVDFLTRYQDDLSEEDAETIGVAAAATERWLQLRLEPFSILHGDYRLDNLMFDPSGRDVVAVDWQTAIVGPPMRDVAYFIGTCLDVDQRRSTEQQLLTGYHDEIVARGITDYPFEQCYEDYRLGQLQATMITTLGAVFAAAERTPESDGMFLAMARRSAAAIRDLGSLDWV